MQATTSGWARPELLGWAAVTALAELLLRLPFLHAQLVPHYLDFTPGVVLVPLAGVFLGPAGAWATLAASLLGDRLLGGWDALAAFRAVGLGAWAWSAHRLWAFSAAAGGRAHRPTHLQTLRFLFVALPGGLAAAAWTALGAEALRIYPFTYFASLGAVQHVLFSTLFGLALYPALARWWGGRRNGPRPAGTPALPGGPGPTSGVSALLLCVGGVGAVAGGLWISHQVYRMDPLQPFVLGTSTGAGVLAGVLPWLLVQLVGLLRR